MKFTQKAKNSPHIKNGLLRVGYVPLLDSAPIIIGKELGVFDQFGLKVKIRKVLGWASVRDKILYSELDASQAVVGLPFAMSAGLGCPQRPCVAPIVLNLHGNAITLSVKITQAGVQDAITLGLWKLNIARKLVFGVVSKVSTHYFLMKEFLTQAGLTEGSDYEMAIVPPPLVCANLEAGTIDGFCVGEPWNSIAVKRKVGQIIEWSADLSSGHPEKVLMMTEQFAQKRTDEVLLLNKAILEACEFCDQNPDQVADIMARKEYLNISASLLSQCLNGKGKDIKNRNSSALHKSPFIFQRFDANRPTWSKSDWILQRMVAAGMLNEEFRRRERIQRSVFREDIFEASLGIKNESVKAADLIMKLEN